MCVLLWKGRHGRIYGNRMLLKDRISNRYAFVLYINCLVILSQGGERPRSSVWLMCWTQDFRILASIPTPGMVRFWSLGNFIYPNLPQFTQLQLNTNIIGKVPAMENSHQGRSVQLHSKLFTPCLNTGYCTETVGEGFRCKDQLKSKMWLRGRTARVQEGERNSRQDVRPETDGGEEIGGKGQCGSGVRWPWESYWHSTQGDGDGDATVDGSTRSGSEDGWGHVREDNSKSGGGRRSIGGVWGQYWTATGQRAEPAAVHSSTGPPQQEDGDEGCHEETPLYRRPDPGGERQTGATGDTGIVERAVYQTRTGN